MVRKMLKLPLSKGSLRVLETNNFNNIFLRYHVFINVTIKKKVLLNT